MQCKSMNKTSRAFTLVEIMIVVAIIGIILAIAIPSWLNARNLSQRNACLEAQQKINGAIDNFALDEGKSTGDPVTMEDIVDFGKYLKQTPICPVGDTPLQPVAVGTSVTCPNDLHFKE